MRPRRRSWSPALKAGIRFGAILLALGVAAAPAAWAWRSGWFARQAEALTAEAIALTARAGLVLDDVLVTGRNETSRETLLASLKLQRGRPILAIDPVVIRARLEALPWVRSAVVERRLPSTLYIRVVEHEPIALWQRAKRLTLISRAGDVIAEPHLERFAKLPVLVGEDAPAYAASLLDMLAQAPELQRRVVAAVRVGGRRWNVRLDNDVDVRLPEEDAAAAWVELARLEREHHLLERDLVAVDLRTPDRMVVRLTPEAAARRRSPRDST